jgi:hypothetical protein
MALQDVNKGTLNSGLRKHQVAFAPTSHEAALIQKPDRDDGEPAPPRIETDPRWLSVVRLTHAESFAKASRLSSFLLYVVERFLQGRIEEITEQQIGVHVFGRPAGYNPGDDNIVRQTARQLRQRLALYYQEEGRSEPIQVIIPRGGYVPHFQETSELAPPPELLSAELATGSAAVADPGNLPEEIFATPLNAAGWWSQKIKSAALVGCGLLLGLALALVADRAKDLLLHPPTQSDKLWSVLFTSKQRTIVVPGDAGVNMYGNLARTQVDIWEYGSGSYLSKPDAQTPAGFNWAPFAARRYTTISDLKFVSTLLQIPNVDRSRMELRFARDLTAEDLKQSNVILIGSSNYDPWIQIFDKNQNFNMVYNGTENSISILNRSPLKGEQASYTWSEMDPQRTGYAIISLTDNLGSTGKVLLVEGTTMGGIDAATDFLFHSPQMNTIVRDAIGKNQKPSNFELLLMTTIYMGGSMKAKVIGERIHSPA